MTSDEFRAIFTDIGQLFFYHILEKELSSCKTVLDVGCGADSPLGKIRKKFRSAGIDIFERCIIESKKKKIHNEYRVGDIRKLDKYYKTKSFDAVITLDVIEHFNKKEALQLIKKMEEIAKKKVILLTPNGFLKQDSLEGNLYQIHHSGWSKEELEKLGYKVYGLRGLKCLRNEYAGIKYKPYFLWGYLSFLSEIIFYPFPSLCFDLFALKQV